MKYLLDTDTISFAVRVRPSEVLTDQLRRTPIDDVATSSITIGEIWYGVYRRADSGPGLRDGIVRTLSGIRVIAFDRQAAMVYAETRDYLDRAGQPLAEADLRIAAIALVNDLTVVTGNVRHFERVPGLRVENWLEPKQ